MVCRFRVPPVCLATCSAATRPPGVFGGAAGHVLGIELLNHIVSGRGQFVSIKDQRLM